MQKELTIPTCSDLLSTPLRIALKYFKPDTLGHDSSYRIGRQLGKWSTNVFSYGVYEGLRAYFSDWDNHVATDANGQRVKPKEAK